MKSARRRRTVLVTGGGGALGTIVCRLLKQRAHTVVAFDHQPPIEPVLGVRYIQDDLRDRRAVGEAVDSVDAVVHTAALHGLHLVQGCSEDELFTNNVLSTFNVLSSCANAKIRKVVFTSSTSTYGASADPEEGRAAWLDESTPQRWRDLYDATKVIGETLCRWYASEHDANVVALRVTRFFFDDYVSYNTRKLFRGVDLHDVATAHLLAAEATRLRGFRAYNIAADSPFEPWETKELSRNAPKVIERHYPGISRLFDALGLRLPKTIGRVYDIDRAQRELGFMPKYNFEQFVRELAQKRSVYEGNDVTLDRPQESQPVRRPDPHED